MKEGTDTFDLSFFWMMKSGGRTTKLQDVTQCNPSIDEYIFYETLKELIFNSGSEILHQRVRGDDSTQNRAKTQEPKLVLHFV